MAKVKGMSKSEAQAEAVKRWGPNVTAYKANGQSLIGVSWKNPAKFDYPEFTFVGIGKTFEDAFADSVTRAPRNLAAIPVSR